MEFSYIFKLILICDTIFFAVSTKTLRTDIVSPKNLKYAIDGITFPEEVKNQPMNDDRLEAIFIRTSNLRNVSDFLKAFGAHLENDNHDIYSRKREPFAEQATCEPEMRTVHLETPPSETNSVFFPKCVRIPRCGGCCGLSELLECVPTKMSVKTLRRARIRVKRSPKTGAAVREATHNRVQVEVHEECKCQCKVQQHHCQSHLHIYKSDVCKCQCIDTNAEEECHRNAHKFWDSTDCSCKCKNVKLCSTGLKFTHEMCRCEEDLSRR